MAEATGAAELGTPHKVSVAARSHCGLLRLRNEDIAVAAGCFVRDDAVAFEMAFARGMCPTVFAVADGLGGHPGGDIASALVARSVVNELVNLPVDAPAETCRRLFEETLGNAHAELLTLGNVQLELQGLGTTFTGMLVTGEAVVVAHAGDSRLYRLRQGVLAPLTRDHAAPFVREAGVARGVLTNCVGAGGELHIDAIDLSARILPGDIYLLATDGLWATFTDEFEADDAIVVALATKDGDKALIDLALSRGGPDNISLVRVEFAAE